MSSLSVFLPSYAKLSNKPNCVNNRFGFVTGGRLGRFIPQYVQLGGVLDHGMGGVLTATAASVGGINPQRRHVTGSRASSISASTCSRVAWAI